MRRGEALLAAAGHRGASSLGRGGASGGTLPAVSELCRPGEIEHWPARPEAPLISDYYHIWT